MKRAVLISIALAALLMGSMFLVTDVAGLDKPDEEEVRVFIIGPDVVGMGQKVSYDVIVTGGPAENGGKWTYRSQIRGMNLTSDTLEPSTGNSTESGFFTGTFTAPNEEQDVEIVVTGISDKDGIRETSEAVKKVKIIRPYTFTATLVNSGNVAVEDLSVSFYVDGTLLESKTVERMDVDEKKTLTSNWTIEDPGLGRHVSKVVIDAEDTGLILEESGSRIFLQEFYIEDEPSSVPWTISIIVLVAAIGGSLYMLRKTGYI